jgi:hypothetical protein
MSAPILFPADFKLPVERARSCGNDIAAQKFAVNTPDGRISLGISLAGMSFLFTCSWSKQNLRHGCESIMNG